MRKWKRRLLAWGGLLAVLYVGSYAVLSRRGYAEADRYSLKGFYYLTPENTDTWRSWNYACVWIFAPLNAVDRLLGTGRPPACEPLWGLSAPRGPAAPTALSALVLTQPGAAPRLPAGGFARLLW